MQNRWFGDKNDYPKYSLIRHLLAEGIQVGFNWMLNPDESNPNPNFIQFLNNRVAYSSFDLDVFDYLESKVLHQGIRNVSAMETGGPIATCRFFSELVPDDRSKRPQYIERFLTNVGDADLLFFDPDTGIETRAGVTNATHKKFVFLNELQLVFERGYSVLVYQHLSRMVEDRAFYLREHVEDVATALQTDSVYPFRTEEVGFLLVIQPEHDGRVQDAMDTAMNVWRGWPLWRPKL